MKMANKITHKLVYMGVSSTLLPGFFLAIAYQIQKKKDLSPIKFLQNSGGDKKRKKRDNVLKLSRWTIAEDRNDVFKCNGPASGNLENISLEKVPVDEVY